jgi:hypothetical protein
LLRDLPHKCLFTCRSFTNGSLLTFQNSGYGYQLYRFFFPPNCPVLHLVKCGVW